MPSGPFAHVCMLVHDVDKAVDDWTRILGVLDPGQLKDPVVRYDDFSGGADKGMRWATFVSPHGAEIQFIQPSPATPLGERLAKVGEHVHHLCFTTLDVPGAMARLAEQGVQVVNGGKTYQDATMPWQEWSWVGPKSAHGVLIEVAQPYESHRDGLWHHAPQGSQPPREVRVSAEFRCSAEHREAFLALMQATMQASQAERGCLVYRFSADLADPLCFHLQEHWADDAAMRVHGQAAHTVHFMKELRRLGKVQHIEAAVGALQAADLRQLMAAA